MAQPHSLKHVREDRRGLKSLKIGTQAGRGLGLPETTQPGVGWVCHLMSLQWLETPPTVKPTESEPDEAENLPETSSEPLGKAE